MDKHVKPKPKRIIPLIIACVFLSLSVIFAFVSSGLIWQNNTRVPDPDQTISEGLAIGITAVILILFFWAIDVLCALVALILGLVSTRSQIKTVKILSICVCVLSFVFGIFPHAYAQFIP